MSHCCTTEKSKSPHIAIIGTGSAAFAAAIAATEQGAKVTLIEAQKNIGGTCVNIGCVPSKIFIRGAYIAHLQQQHGIAGIAPHQAQVDRGAMLQQQQQWVESLRYLKYEKILQQNPNITLVQGHARFVDKHTLAIKQNTQTTTIKADNILIAVGSRPFIPAIPGLSNTPFWTSNEALLAKTLPRHLLVLGGSVIALELAQAFLRLGSKVTLLARSTLLSQEDPQMGAALHDILQREGMNIHLHSTPQKVQYQNGQFALTLDQQTLYGDRLLVATGRQSNADRLDLQQAGINTDQQGNIIVNQYLQSSVAHIYAAGDCTQQPRYVYVAAAAGSRAGKNLCGSKIPLDLHLVPRVVFSDPQVACVGLDEKTAQSLGIKTQSRTLPLEHVPRAIANINTNGLIKMVIEQQSRQIIGCQMVAEQAGEVIQSVALAISNKMTVKQLADQLFPYLTMSEALKLVAQTFDRDISQLSCCVA